jgi:hypothetical protein
VANLAASNGPVTPLSGYRVPTAEEELAYGLVTLEAEVPWLGQQQRGEVGHMGRVTLSAATVAERRVLGGCCQLGLLVRVASQAQLRQLCLEQGRQLSRMGEVALTALVGSVRQMEGGFGQLCRVLVVALATQLFWRHLQHGLDITAVDGVAHPAGSLGERWVLGDLSERRPNVVVTAEAEGGLLITQEWRVVRLVGNVAGGALAIDHWQVRHLLVSSQPLLLFMTIGTQLCLGFDEQVVYD